MTAPDKPEGLIAGGEQVRSSEAASHNTPPAEEDRGERLLPCPICGKSVEMTRHKGSDETGECWDYLAVQCQAKDHLVMCDGGETAAEVASAWNRRALLSSPRVEGETRRKALEEAAPMPASCPEGMGDPSVDCAWPVCPCAARARRAALSPQGE